MKNLRLEILENLFKGYITVKQADEELEALCDCDDWHNYNSSNDCDNTVSKPSGCDWDKPVIGHFKD